MNYGQNAKNQAYEAGYTQEQSRSQFAYELMTCQPFLRANETIKRLEERIEALEAAQPKPIAFPTIDPDLLHAEIQAWAASKKEAR